MTDIPTGAAVSGRAETEIRVSERIDVIAARRTLRLEPDLDGMSHELGVELAAVRIIASAR